MKVVVFLRGINVGGHNVVKKQKLKEAFAEMGFKEVLVYKQSGNVVFETDSKDLTELRSKTQAKLSQLLGSEVGALLRSMDALRQIVKNDPFGDVNEKDVSFLVTFSSQKLPQAETPIRIPNSTADIILIRGFEAYSVTRGHGDGGKPNPYIESKFKTEATTRNWNIVKEISRFYP